MGTMASQITSFTIDYSTVYSGTDQRKHQSSTSLAFARGGGGGGGGGGGDSPVTSEFPARMASIAEMFTFDDIIMRTPPYIYNAIHQAVYTKGCGINCIQQPILYLPL